MSGDLVPAPRVRHRTKREKKAESLAILNAKVLGKRDIDIARELNMSTKTVQRRLDAFVEQHGAAAVESYRQVAEQQLDVLMAAAMAGVAEGDLKAIEVALKVHERRSKLLGLDAVEKTEHVVTVQTEQEKQLQDLLAQAARQEKLREHNLSEG